MDFSIPHKVVPGIDAHSNYHWNYPQAPDSWLMSDSYFVPRLYQLPDRLFFGDG